MTEDDTGDGREDEMAEGTNEGTGGGQMNGMSGEGPVDGPADDQESRYHGDGPAANDAGATRANGLTAAYYVPLRDVDPRVGRRAADQARHGRHRGLRRPDARPAGRLRRRPAPVAAH